MALGSSPEGMGGRRAMQEFGTRRELPDLKKLVLEASQALARLDADRLEELALSCQVLNRDLVPANAEDRAWLDSQAKEAAGEMTVFARVLEATRANLKVMKRLQELRTGCLEYGELQTCGWSRTESRHGNN